MGLVYLGKVVQHTCGLALFTAARLSMTEFSAVPLRTNTRRAKQEDAMPRGQENFEQGEKGK